MTTEAPQALPRPVSDQKRELNRLLNNFACACHFDGDDNVRRMSTGKAIHDYCDTLVSERDALAVRVAELTDCLEWVRGYISRYDPPSLPNHIAQRIDAALKP